MMAEHEQIIAEEEEDDDDDEGFYSVWAQPPASSEIKVSIAALMERLRKDFGGTRIKITGNDHGEEELYEIDSDPPEFEPHVTILGVLPSHQKISLRKAMAALRSACLYLRPFSCRLTRPSSGCAFYQCVFMLVDPSPQVMQAHQHVHSFFEREASSEYNSTKQTYFMPHLSLYYGDLAQENKEKAVGLIESEFRHAVCEKEFIVSSLCLYSTDTSDKSLKSWKKVAEFPLGGESIIKP